MWPVAIKIFVPTTKRGRGEPGNEAASDNRVSLMFLPHFDVFSDQLLNRRTETWNIVVLYTKETKMLISSSMCLSSNWSYKPVKMRELFALLYELYGEKGEELKLVTSSWAYGSFRIWKLGNYLNFIRFYVIVPSAVFIVDREKWLWSPAFIKGTNKDAYMHGKIYVGRSTTMHNLLFCVHTQCMSYAIKTFLLASSSVSSKLNSYFVLCTVKATTENRNTQQRSMSSFMTTAPLLTM